MSSKITRFGKTIDIKLERISNENEIAKGYILYVIVTFDKEDTFFKTESETNKLDRWVETLGHRWTPLHVAQGMTYASFSVATVLQSEVELLIERWQTFHESVVDNKSKFKDQLEIAAAFIQGLR